MSERCIDPCRRRIVAALPLALICGRALAAAEPKLPVAEVWKEASCGCCNDWIAHLRKSGFTVRVFETGNADIRKRLGIADRYGSCHTAKIGAYAVEGHVPAREIQRLLREKPDAVGLAVPGMPIGSPGMDGPVYQNRKDPYDVLLVQRDGSARTYQSYR